MGSRYWSALKKQGRDITTDAATYTHPALRAEDHVQCQLLAQAPRTEAELVLLQAECALHASYLYGNSHITERRCLTCEVTYPCPTARALGLDTAP